MTFITSQILACTHHYGREYHSEHVNRGTARQNHVAVHWAFDADAACESVLGAPRAHCPRQKRTQSSGYDGDDYY